MGATSEHFKEYELRCRGEACCGGVNLAEPSLLMAAEKFRAELAKELGREAAVIVLSGSRCFTHNRRVGGARLSQHCHGRALDVRSPGVSAAVLEKVARKVTAIRGIGRGRDMVHIDVRSGPFAEWCYDEQGRHIPYFPLREVA